MTMRTDLPTQKHDLLWLRRTFETHLPVVTLCTIIIPTIMFGMFTMGLNPEDSALRTTYYLVITAAMPVSILAGYVLALIPARKVLLATIDVATSVAAFLSYAWFQARVSIVPADMSSTFPGWQWQSHYQQDVLVALVVIASCRCGMSFPRRGSRPSLAGDLSFILATAFSLVLVAAAFIISWLLGTWWLLHLYTACFAIVGVGIQVLLPDRLPSIEARPATNEPKENVWMPILFGFGIPLLILAQGFTIGLSLVANSWTAGWLGHIGIILLTAGLVACAVLAIETRTKKAMASAWLLIAAAGLLLGLVVLLILHVFLPVELGWSVASGSAAGLAATALARLAMNTRHPFHATVHLLLAIFCALIGVGGGIAFYLYEVQLDIPELGVTTLWVNALVSCIVFGSVTLAIAIFSHVPAVSSILRALFRKVKESP